MAAQATILENVGHRLVWFSARAVGSVLEAPLNEVIPSLANLSSCAVERGPVTSWEVFTHWQALTDVGESLVRVVVIGVSPGSESEAWGCVPFESACSDKTLPGDESSPLFLVSV